MQSDRWRRIEEIFCLVLEQPTAERRRLIDKLCADDPELQREVLELLEADLAADGFLETPPRAVADIDLEALAERASRKARKVRRQEETAVLPEDFLESDRYRLIRKLGAGGMGLVYEAKDRQRGEHVALKMMKTGAAARSGKEKKAVDPEMLYRIKQEFRSLVELNDVNLVTLHEMVVSEDLCYYTMELIDGIDVLSYVRQDSSDTTGSPYIPPSSPAIPSSSGEGYSSSDITPRPSLDDRDTGYQTPQQPIHWPTCDEHRLRSVLPQLVRGLNVLHTAGKLHRDVKPSNILVTSDGRVVLLDFGLVTQVEADEQSMFSQLIGTARYMAPEQCLGEQLNPAADWYAVGILLYEALTSRPPYRGSFGKMMLEKIQHPPPRPRDAVIGVPRDLDELCVAMLARNPEDRPSAAEILRLLGADQESGQAQTVPQRAPPFAGRAQELAGLARYFSAVHDGQTYAVLVYGESGVGKSALIRTFLDGQRSQHPDLVVLEGRCYDRESVPYQAIDSLIDNLSRYWRRLPAIRAAELVPREAGLLPKLFPVLGRVPAVVEAPFVREISDPQERRTRSFAALRETLQRLGERCLLVLFLDDMQWADANTLYLLADLLRPPDPPRLMLLLVSRPESRGTLGELLNSMDAVTKVESLEALPGEAAETLARQLLGEELGHLAERVAEEAAGNPFFIIELARHLQFASGALSNGSANQSFEHVSLESVLRQRIQTLPEAARRVLEIVSLAGAHLPQRTLRRCTGLSKTKLAHHLSLLRNLKLVRTSGRQDSLEPYHDRIRDATLSSLTAQSRADHHRSLALALEGKAPAEQLAYHWRGAGEGSRAAEHALVAAAESLTRLDFDRAANLFRMALRLGSHTQQQRCEIIIKLAEAAANAGRPAESAAAYTQASRETSDPTVQLELHRCSAEELLRGGYLEEGLQAISRVLASIGIRLSKTAQRALISLLLRRSWLFFRGLRFRARSASDIPPRVLARIDICWSVLIGLSCVEPIRATEYNARHLLMALRAGEQRRIARALVIEVCYLAAQSPDSRRLSKALSSLHTVTPDDPYLRALACLGVGFANYNQDNSWRQARDRCQEAEDILRTLGGGWELDNARLWRCYSQIYLGQLAELARQVPLYARAADRRGDRYMSVTIRTRANLIWLVRDEVERARQELDRAIASWMPAKEIFQLQHMFALWAGCEISLYRGDPQQAATRMRESIAQVQGSLMLRVQMVNIEITCLQARIALATAALLDRDARRPYIRDACSSIKRLQRIPLPLARSLVPGLQAGVAHLQDDDAAAERLLRQGLASLESLETMLWATAVRRRLGEQVGVQEGAELIARSDEWMTAQGVRNPARITALLVPGWQLPDAE